MSRALLFMHAEEERRKKQLKLTRRTLRDSSNPLMLPHNLFVRQFRLTKTAFHELCGDVIPHLPHRARATAIRDELKILAALAFYGHGSYQRGIGTSYLHNMSQSTLSNCLEEVTNAMNSREILLKYIKFPSERERRECIMADFMDNHGFPGVTGVIDASHVAIIRPVEHEETYFNRKGYHSVNVLTICDMHLNILHVDASHGGAAHDSFIWTQSPIKAYMEHLHSEGERCWLLGDSGFVQRPYLMTPIVRAAEGSPEDHYNKMHCSARDVIERCFGLLKARWRCLLAHRVLHYTPQKAEKIVNACAVLHNIANAHNVPVPTMTDDDMQALRRSQASISTATPADSNADDRMLLVQRLWAARRN